jgi:hypothetical protein
MLGTRSLGGAPMIHVVGGAYLEDCVEPEWRQLYGSGLRAAAAISGLVDKCALSTYVAEGLAGDLQVIVDTFGIDLVAQPSPQTPLFEYRYPLARPRLFVPSDGYTSVQPLSVHAEAVLRFGMIECEAIVEGEFVVYDPQSEATPANFHENGSRAERLVVVANEAELVGLTQLAEPARAAEQLLKDWRAEAVVIKRGARGAAVLTPVASHVIPSFRTQRVWPIGSGDVFSALFSYFWAVKHLPPENAALAASHGTSAYCESQVLPVPPELFDTDVPAYRAVWPSGEGAPQIYLAGPFFTVGERWVIAEARRALSGQGLRVFSPLHDVGFGTAEEIAPQDLRALEACDGVFAVIDGLDAGTLFEVGYARALNIPVVAWAERATDADLVMLRGSGCEIVKDLTTAVYRAAWAALAGPVK